MGLAYPPSVKAVAKNNGRPGTTSSGCLTYGTIGSSGCLVQAVMPAMASEAPISFRNPRPRNRVQPLRRTLGKFAMHHLLEVRAARQLFKAAPVLRAFGPGDAVAGGVQSPACLSWWGKRLRAAAIIFFCPSFADLLTLWRPGSSTPAEIRARRPSSSRILPVTGRTTRNVGYRSQLVLLHQVRSQRSWSVYSLPSTSTGLLPDGSS